MSTEKKVLQLEARTAPACSLCGAQNTDTRKITITGHDSNLATFHVCRSCLKTLALNIAAAWFDFSGTQDTKTPEDQKKA